MKKTLKSILLVGVLTLFSVVTNSYADGFYQYGHMLNPANIQSLHGTYKVDDIRIMQGDRIILDSDDDFSVRSETGRVTIRVQGNNIIINYEVKMRGSFTSNPQLVKYAYMKDTQSLVYTNSLEAIGLSIWDDDDLFIKLPLPDGNTIIIEAEKKGSW